MNEKRQLLCTFSTDTTFEKTIEEIKRFYRISDDGKFFVFLNTISPKEIFITYNVIGIQENQSKNKLHDTISIHRKKLTNTLYTLNAMNRLIEDENNGVFDKKFSVNWSLYQNSLIITNEISVKIIPIKIFDIIS